MCIRIEERLQRDGGREMELSRREEPFNDGITGYYQKHSKWTNVCTVYKPQIVGVYEGAVPWETVSG